eukprot:gene3261-3306_t
MNSLAHPADLLSVAILVLLLGMRHGFDADHLAAIDGLTRYNHKDSPKLAKYAGFLFSLGHGLIIVPISVSAATLTRDIKLPDWLDGFGTWTSVSILLALAIANIHGVLHTPNTELVSLRGWRYRWFAKLLNVRSPYAMLAVGALFALSFDTLSQASLFAVIALEYQRWQLALVFALVFVVGMLITDGINGLFIANLITRSDQTARIASRVMALSVASVSILVAVLNIAGATLPDFETWRTGKELWFGAVVMGVLIASYGLVGLIMDIANKVFIVTGGASGLGAGTARMLTANGAHVVIADLQDEAGQALAAELKQRYVHCDVTSQADGQAVVASAVEMGKLMGLVNCAGIAPASRIVGKQGAHDLDLFKKVVTINLIGSFNMARLAAEAMCKNDPESTGERGVLINTASVAAYEGQIGQAAYSASKGGVVGMTLPIARDLAGFGVRCVTIAPGIFEDYAKLVLSIMTNEMINGETIRLDGAIRLAPK